jgi:6-bladed beta-propeller/Strictosidine synthase-like, N-terminal
MSVHSRIAVRLFTILSLSALVGVGICLEAAESGFTLAEGWGALPSGQQWGEVTGVAVDGKNTIIAVRRSDPPVIEMNPAGRVLKMWGEKLFVWPHGFRIDKEGFLWITDGRAADGRGEQIFKIAPDGRIVMTLGTKGVAGETATTFAGPADVAFGANGDIFVADGHVNNRVVKFSKDGQFIKSWGKKGTGPGEFSVPHAVAIDSRGRVFVADRGNRRIQIFDQDGRYLEAWTQFGRPSGLLITADDTIYVADVQDKPGISFGSAKDGTVRGTIEGTLPESIAIDRDGSVYAGETTTGHILRKFTRR